MIRPAKELKEPYLPLIWIFLTTAIASSSLTSAAPTATATATAHFRRHYNLLYTIT
jgi:hypothetical protein